MAGVSVISGWSFCHIRLVFLSYMAGLCVIYGVCKLYIRVDHTPFGFLLSQFSQYLFLHLVFWKIHESANDRIYNRQGCISSSYSYHICFVIEVELTHCFMHLYQCLLHASSRWPGKAGIFEISPKVCSISLL